MGFKNNGTMNKIRYNKIVTERIQYLIKIEICFYSV